MTKFFNCLLFVFILFFLDGSNIFARNNMSASDLSKDLKLEIPRKGFISAHKAVKWEESLLTGNGTIGALIKGNPGDEVIILSHEKLFMPEYPPTKAPDIKKYLGEIRQLILNGQGEKAAELAVQAGKEAGIEKVIWTDPLVPACQLEIKEESPGSVSIYAKTVNYETGEATVAWKSERGIIHERMFVSRADSVGVIKISSPSGSKLNFRFRLNQLPLPKTEADDEEDSFDVNELISAVKTSVDERNLTYSTLYKKQWEGSLKGYNVTVQLSQSGGSVKTEDGWLLVNNAGQIILTTSIHLFYNLPVKEDPLQIKLKPDYDDILARHKAIQAEMFNRFSLNLAGAVKQELTSEELLASSRPGHLSKVLIEKLCEAARYSLISSTGELPPTLQGIWGGTWRPAWSSDFTLNGNVPSAIACGLNGNFKEVTEAYLNYMWSMFNDFKDNARNVYGAAGIWILSRTSDSGRTYHYLVDYPHMFWFAGSAWTAQFFYDYWLYTGDKNFLQKRAIPFMQAALAFYEDIITRDQSGKIMFIPSYSPEIGPLGYYPAAINATMDIAALKQLLRNLITLAQQGWITKDRLAVWEKMIDDLPAYGIDERGDLKEWLWPGYRNNNQHRHASHLYPLFYEMDPDFEQNADLQKAAVQAIENRLQYRRGKNGAEMAFGLVQLGLAAAHLKDNAHAFECVDWLCNSYWSPSFTSYHDPGRIFNVDICGGLPALVIEMLVQSSPNTIDLLPALPGEWDTGKIKGILTRCGVTVDLEWKYKKPVNAVITASRDTRFKLRFAGRDWPLELRQGQTIEWQYSGHK